MFTYPSSRFGSEHPTVLKMQLEDYELLEAAEAQRSALIRETEAGQTASLRSTPLAVLRGFLGRGFHVLRAAPR